MCWCFILLLVFTQYQSRSQSCDTGTYSYPGHCPDINYPCACDGDDTYCVPTSNWFCLGTPLSSVQCSTDYPYYCCSVLKCSSVCSNCDGGCCNPPTPPLPPSPPIPPPTPPTPTPPDSQNTIGIVMACVLPVIFPIAIGIVCHLCRKPPVQTPDSPTTIEQQTPVETVVTTLPQQQILEVQPPDQPRYPDLTNQATYQEYQAALTQPSQSALTQPAYPQN